MATTGFWLDASVNRMGGIAFTGSDASWPTQYSRGIAEMELGWSEEVRWTSGDGTKNDGVVTYPPDFVAGKKYPLVLYIHGGPRSASKVAFSNFAQLFSAQGWGVFEPNYRGSDNLGMPIRRRSGMMPVPGLGG